MRFYKYIYWDNRSEGVVAYNGFVDELLILNEVIYNLIKEHENDIESLQTIHPALFEALKEKSYIVDNSINETEALINHWDKIENDPRQYSIIVLPTLKCNMACYYCYEKHDGQTVMTASTLQSVQNLVKTKVSSPELKIFNLDFFGGEPLVCYKNVCRPLIEYASNLCRDKEKQLTIHFTTNGYLLTPAVISFLKSQKFPVSMQITLDGNKESHNRVRKTITGKPSYDRIITNIKNALKNGIAINCRINFTYENANTVPDIMDSFNDLDAKAIKNLNFNLQQVWQDHDIHRLEKTETKLWDLFHSKGLPMSNPAVLSSRHCYADYENNVVIGYDGKIYKCTARDFNTSSSEGELNADGTITFNNRYHQRISLKRGNSCCKVCKIFPICHANCSQFAMEHLPLIDDSKCLFGYSEQDKTKKITDRINAMIDSNQ